MNTPFVSATMPVELAFHSMKICSRSKGVFVEGT